MKKIFLSLMLTLSLVMSSLTFVSAETPSVEKTEYKGNGRVEVEFYGKVKYKNLKITVKDSKGKKYSVKNVKKDDDEVEFVIKKFKQGETYKATIKGIKKKNTKGYGKKTVSVKIPVVKKNTSVTRDKAIELAKVHAKKTWGAGNFWDIKCEKDYENGKSVWEVSFNAISEGATFEYDYDIDMSGNIIVYSRETDD